PGNGGLGKGRHVGLALVPPIGKAALRVDVDQADRACPRQLRLHRKMAGQGRLARSALLRCQCQDAHAFPLATVTPVARGSGTAGSKIWLTATRPCWRAMRSRLSLARGGITHECQIL